VAQAPENRHFYPFLDDSEVLALLDNGGHNLLVLGVLLCQMHRESSPQDREVSVQ
jgi:hypothetical protein